MEFYIECIQKLSDQMKDLVQTLEAFQKEPTPTVASQVEKALEFKVIDLKEMKDSISSYLRACAFTAKPENAELRIIYNTHAEQVKRIVEAYKRRNDYRDMSEVLADPAFLEVVFPFEGKGKVCTLTANHIKFLSEDTTIMGFVRDMIPYAMMALGFDNTLFGHDFGCYALRDEVKVNKPIFRHVLGSLIGLGIPVPRIFEIEMGRMMMGKGIYWNITRWNIHHMGVMNI